MSKHNELTAWLESHNHHNVKPCTVTIRGKVYEGADYQTTMKWESGMQGVQDGRHKAGDEYTNRSIYLKGERPKIKGRHCFSINGEEDEWYVSGYFDKECEAKSTNEQMKYHPFGCYFMISPWNLPEKIDRYEPKKYVRIKAELQYQ